MKLAPAETAIKGMADQLANELGVIPEQTWGQV